MTMDDYAGGQVSFTQYGKPGSGKTLMLCEGESDVMALSVDHLNPGVSSKIVPVAASYNKSHVAGYLHLHTMFSLADSIVKTHSAPASDSFGAIAPVAKDLATAKELARLHGFDKLG